MATATYSVIWGKRKPLAVRKPFNLTTYFALFIIIFGLMIMQGHAQRGRTDPRWDATRNTIGAGAIMYGLGGLAGCGPPCGVAGATLGVIAGAITYNPQPAAPAWPQPSDMPDFSPNPNIPDAPPPQPSGVAFGGGGGGAAFDEGNGSSGGGDTGGQIEPEKEHMSHPSVLAKGTNAAKSVLGHTRIDWRNAATNALANTIAQHNLSQRYIGPPVPVRIRPPIRVIIPDPTVPVRCLCGQKPVRTH